MNLPKTRRENLEWRAQMLRRVQLDPEYRESVRELFFRDILFAFNAFFYTYDPRKRPLHHIPFMTWDYEDEAILELQRSIKVGEDIIWEKSRDMGATWMVIGVFTYNWLDPKGGQDFLLGSRIEDYVDKKGDPRTLFHKSRYIINRLPKFILPKGFSPNKHDNYMRLLNPETGATIVGESNNPNYSTGGRYAASLFDEFAKWENSDESAWTAAGDATPCRVAVSTAWGAGGKFYDLIMDGKTKKRRLHWSIHPEKALGLSCIWPPPNEGDKERLGQFWKPDEKLTSPWYEKEIARRTALEVMQELDIDYVGSGNPVFDGKSSVSLSFYRKLPDEPVEWYYPDTEKLTLNKASKPIRDEGYFLFYKPLDKRKAYAIGVDVVEGTENGDYGTIVGINRETKGVDFTYYSRSDEVMLGRILFALQKAIHSHHTWIGIETTGPGLSTFDTCIGLGMFNLFMSPRYDVVNGGVSYKKGWRTDQASRNELISGIRSYLLDRIGELNSQRLVGELTTFVRTKTGKAEAKSGCHDDLLMGFGIALQVDQLSPAMTEKTQVYLINSMSDVYQIPREAHKLKMPEDNSIEARCLRQVVAAKELEGTDNLDLLISDDVWLYE